jgi:hypothetical protein
MAQGPERKFRTSQVAPFLRKLKTTAHFPIQQKAIRGDADYILCAHGWFVWLELKKSGGKQDPLQVFKAVTVERCKGVVIVASPDNWEQVKKLLLQLDRGERS